MSDDDYGDDDFEAYDDDFDEPEEKPVESSNSKSAKQTAEMDELRLAMEQENRAARSSPAPSHHEEYGNNKHSIHALGSASAHSKGAQSGQADSSTSRESKGSEAKGFDNRTSMPAPLPKKHAGSDYTMDFSTSILSTQTDPRMKRLNRLRGATVAPAGGAQGKVKKGNSQTADAVTCVFDLQEDSFMQLNITPISKFDYYHRNLRLLPPAIKQMGVPQELDSREMETNTDEIEVCDVGMQFSSGSDDTLLLDIIETVRAYKRKVKKNGEDGDLSKQLVESIHANKFSNAKKMQGHGGGAPATSSTGTMTGAGDSSFQSASKLGHFLHKSAELVDGLLGKGELDEDSGEYKDGGGDRGSDSNSTISSVPFQTTNKALARELFSSRTPSWRPLTTQNQTDPLSWIMARPPSQVCSSVLNSNMICSIHPYVESNKGDRKAFRTIYCVWDLLAADTPAYLLEASAQSNCVCFSATQPHVLLGGNGDSCLDLFDLRENSTLHQSKESAASKGGKVIRKPCYTTNFQRNSAATKALFSSDSAGATYDKSDSSSGEHRGCIVQVEGIGGAVDGALVGANSVSQFISVDEYSTMFLWITMDSYSNNLLSTAKGGTDSSENAGISLLAAVDDYGLSPWSTMKLTLSRRLECGVTPSPNTTVSLHDCTNMLMNGNVLLGLVPGDSTTTFLCSNSSLNNDIQKVARLGEPTHPNRYSRLFGGVYIESKVVMETSNGFNNGTSASNFSSVVTAISVTSGITSDDQPATTVDVGGHDDCKEDDDYYKSGEPDEESDSAGATSTTTRGAANNSFYILAGRSDGTIDLYDMRVSVPLVTWKPFDHVSGGSVDTADAIIHLKWLNHVTFLAVDAHGYIYIYDLASHVEIPILVDNSLNNRVGGGRGSRGKSGGISVDTPVFKSGGQIAISIPMQQSVLNSNITISVVCPMSNGGDMKQIVTRKLNEKVGLAANKSTAAGTECSISSALKDTSTRIFQSCDHINHTSFAPVGSHFLGTGTEHK